ncbi:MAG: sn-glycerol-3-phosphate ABC transporter ATP-binding protein UgpC [Candidatus Cloacimonetes bacterium]|nr:sn-glycerol-3-phosphate ABC transporter ATP-binding protein UgpC [Candidatus Cloacimonadota bacterium]
MAKVTIEAVNKSYENGFKAVKNASFTADENEFVVLVGPSGCGKTTLLRMIAGLETITEGSITIDNRIVNDVPAKDRDIAMVFQNYALYPHLTVYENMAFALKLRKFSKAAIKEKVSKTANLLKIEELLTRLPKQLSGGQRQRVALGRAIVRNPKVFLFDEPLSNLDAKMRVQMRTEISKLHNTLKSTMIYVTHDQVEAMTMGSKIVVMKEGVIQQIGKPLEVYNKPKNMFVASFIGSPSMNFIRGEVVSENGSLYFSHKNIKLPAGDNMSNYVSKEVILGIRPEDIYDSRFKEKSETFVEIDSFCDLVEPLGNEYMVYLTAANNSLVARFSPVAEPEMNKTLKVSLDLSKAHFFDINTEETIGN